MTEPMTEPMTNDVSKEYANRLLVADDPDEVAEILNELMAEFDSGWSPLGGNDNNYGTVYAQAASPMPSFAELPMNSMDAQMFKFYDHNAPDDVGPMDYTSMKDAVNSDWVDVGQADIEILADGYKPQSNNPDKKNLVNFTVRDDGKGKRRDQFEDFVDLSRAGVKKQEFGFTQGQYGMGSTAVLQFCGNIDEEYNDRCFKFIASASVEEPGKWSWTVVRGNPYDAQFEYLTVDDAFPTFDGSFGGALADKFINQLEYDQKNLKQESGPQEYGTFVKVYDYRTQASRTQISPSESWGYLFERYLVDSPFPITLTDMRYGNKIPQTETQGFLPKLDGNREELLAGEEHITIDTDSDSLGERDAHIILFKHDDDIDDEATNRRGKDEFVQKATNPTHATSRKGIQKDHAVMLTVNGQTHGALGTYFLKRLGYSKIADDTVVIVNFDDLANLGMVKMFSPSRDALKQSPQKDKFIEALEDALKNSDLLQEEDERRRARHGTEETQVDTESFEDFVERNPNIINYISRGEKAAADFLRPTDGNTGIGGQFKPDEDGPNTLELPEDGGDETETEEEEDDDDIEEPKIPTELKLIRDYDPDGDHTYWREENGFMPVEMPVNKGIKIRFKTDAQNNYFARDVLSGEFNLVPSNRFRSLELQDGLLTLTIDPRETDSVGDEEALNVQLTRPDPAECDLLDDPEDALPEDADEQVATDGGELDTRPLTASLNVKIVEPVEKPSQTPTVTNEDETDDETENNDDPDADEEETNTSEGDGTVAGERDWDMPEINRVKKVHWGRDDDGEPIDEEKFDPATAREFDENTLLRIDQPRNDDSRISDLTLTINMDAAPLRQFIVEENVKENWKQFVEKQYELAVVFYAIAEYRELVDAYGLALDESEILIHELIEHTINGIGQTLMPTIVPQDQLDRITE